MLLHGCRAFAEAGPAMPAKIRHDQLISRRKKLRDRQKKLVVCRSRMQQDDRQSASSDIIENFGVATINLFHGRCIKSRGARLSPTSGRLDLWTKPTREM